MLSKTLSIFLSSRGKYYGWVVVAIAFLTMLSTAGVMGSAGVLVQPLQDEFGWTTEQISIALSVRLAFYGLLGPFVAVFMNQWGIRTIASTALTMLLCAICASFFMTQLWQLIALWGIVIGVGTGMTALVLGVTVAARWFETRRGLVIGIMTASNATGSLLFLPMLASITEIIGWRIALTVLVAVLLVTVILILLFMCDRPADLGLPRYGDINITPKPVETLGIWGMLFQPIRTLIEVSTSLSFWVLFGTFFICGFSTNGLIQMHWISICGDLGLTAVPAASFLAVIGIFDLLGTLLSGWLSDKFDNRWLLFWFYGLRGLSLFCLAFSGFTIIELSVFAIFYGLDWVATVPPTVKLTAQKFGADRMPLVFGWIFMGHQLGAAVAAFFAGAIRTNFYNYMPALMLAGVLCILASMLIMLLTKISPISRDGLVV